MNDDPHLYISTGKDRLSIGGGGGAVIGGGGSCILDAGDIAGFRYMCFRFRLEIFAGVLV